MKTINCFISEKLKITKKMLNNQYEYVDLDLPSGTLWADRNVGAKTETEYGDYFAWGETKHKNEYSWETYKFGRANNLTKYNDKDKLTNIKLTDDPTYVNMGKNWGIPTKKQFTELIDNTTHEVVENYNNSGIDGMLFTAKNGNTLFLPCAGFINNTSNDAISVDGLYWMSNIDPNDSNNAYYLYFWDTSLYTVVTNRCYGLSVRGVLNK
jgi:hypothetical protein